MKADVLLSHLDSLGVRVYPSGKPGMVMASPPELLTPELREEIANCKAELLALLEARQPPSKAWADPEPPPAECPPSDPRPELDDSLPWAYLLAYATPDRMDRHGLFAMLHLARRGGARLRFVGGRWKVKPEIDPGELGASIWQDEAAWNVDTAHHLLPHADRLTRLLRLVPPPSRLGAPPSEPEAGVAALRALGWTFKVKSDGGLTAVCPDGLSDPDVAWCKAHVDQLVELLQGEGE